MSKLQRSWLLFKNSLSIMTRNKQLLVFPIIVFLFTMLIVLFFLAPVVLRPTGFTYTSAQHWQFNVTR
jgi:type II secretory pathway component PulF